MSEEKPLEKVVSFLSLQIPTHGIHLFNIKAIRFFPSVNAAFFVPCNNRQNETCSCSTSYTSVIFFITDVKNVTILVYRRPGCSLLDISHIDSSCVSHCV